MIGEKKKSDKLFYYLRPEALIPENHILRLIDHYVDFSFIRSKVEHLTALRVDRRSCPVKQQCTRSSYRSLSYHIYESSIDIARKLTKTRGYRISQRMRKRIEELFGEAKDCMGLRRMKFRGALFVREQVLLTAAAQNIKRMARLLSRMGPNKEAKTQAVRPPPGVSLFIQFIFRWIDFFCWQFRPLLV